MGNSKKKQTKKKPVKEIKEKPRAFVKVVRPKHLSTAGKSIGASYVGQVVEVKVTSEIEEYIRRGKLQVVKGLVR